MLLLFGYVFVLWGAKQSVRDEKTQSENFTSNRRRRASPMIEVSDPAKRKRDILRARSTSFSVSDSRRGVFTVSFRNKDLCDVCKKGASIRTGGPVGKAWSQRLKKKASGLRAMASKLRLKLFSRNLIITLSENGTRTPAVPHAEDDQTWQDAEHLGANGQGLHPRSGGQVPRRRLRLAPHRIDPGRFVRSARWTVQSR